LWFRRLSRRLSACRVEAKGDLTFHAIGFGKLYELVYERAGLLFRVGRGLSRGRLHGLSSSE
jgi:hypothetical protein